MQIASTHTVNGVETEDGGATPFAKWPHLMEVVALLAVQRLICWLKARQIGASWLVAAYVLWMASYHKAAFVMMFSQNEFAAIKLLEKVKFIYRHLPKPLQEPVKSLDNQLQIVFTANGSEIVALPSTKNAGRGNTATLAVFDEADFHPEFDANLSAVKPTVDAGGQLILLSTSNPDTVTPTEDNPFGSGFKQVYHRAPANGYKALFYSWAVRPGRSEAWYAAIRAEATDMNLFEKENPRTAAEALAPPSNLLWFDRESLDGMREECRKPIEVLPNGVTSIYVRPAVGRRYCAFTDTSHGGGRDYAVTGVMDAGTNAIVADVFSNVIDPDQLALYSVELLALYFNPVWGIEDNEQGGITLKRAQELGYKNLYWRIPRGERSDGKVGWHTDESNRWDIYGEAQSAVKRRQLTVYNEKGLGHFYNVIRNPAKMGKPEAVGSAHDDYAFMCAGVWEMRKHARESHAPGNPMGRAMAVRVGKRW